MKQIHLKLKSFNSLLALMYLLHLSTSTKTFYPQIPDLFFSSFDGKIWQPLDSQILNFQVERFDDDYDEEDEESINMGFLAVLSLKQPGWIVKKGETNQQNKLENGDFVEIFESPDKKVNLLYFLIPHKKTDVDDYSSKDFLTLVNKGLEHDPDLSIQIPLYLYDDSKSSNAKFASVYSNNKIMSNILGGKKFNEVFKLKKTDKTFEEIMSSKNDREDLIKKLLLESLKTIYVSENWMKLKFPKFKEQLKKGLVSISEDIINDGNAFLEDVVSKTDYAKQGISKEQFAKMFGNLMDDSKLNLLFTDINQVDERTNLYIPPLKRWEDKKDAFTLLFKHRLITRLFLNSRHFDRLESNEYLDISERLDALLPDEEGEFGEDHTNVVLMNWGVSQVLKITTDPLWMSMFYYMSRIRDLNAILETYAQQSLYESAVFLNGVSNNMIDSSHIDFTDDPYVEVEMLTDVDRRNRLLLV